MCNFGTSKYWQLHRNYGLICAVHHSQQLEVLQTHTHQAISCTPMIVTKFVMIFASKCLMVEICYQEEVEIM